MRNAGLIAVRKGSKRIPDKNIKDFCGSSLLEIKVKQAISCKLIDKVYVSSDCDKMLNISSKLGAIPIRRPPEFCTDSVPMNDVYEHLAKSIDSDHVTYLHVTSPLLKDETLTKSIEKYFNNIKKESHHDSLASVELIKKYLWFSEDPVNYNPNNHPRSQDLPDYYALNFAINIVPREVMVERKNILGKNFYPFFISDIESVDVDNPHEFMIAELIYSSLNREGGDSEDIC